MSRQSERQASAPPVTSGGAVRRFFRGMRYPIAGVRFVYLEHPSLWRYALPQVLLAILTFGLIAWAGVRYGGSLIDLVWAAPEGEGFWSGVLSVLHRVFTFLVAVTLVILGYQVWMAVCALVTAPLKDALSERIESLRTGRAGAPFSMGAVLGEIVRTVKVEGGKLLVYLAVMIPLYALSFAVPWLGQVLLTVLGWYFTSLYLCFDYLDWPMSRRGWGFRHRWRQIGSHRALSLGFGTSCWLMLFVPLANVLLIPAAVAGGTNLFVDLEQAQAFSSPGMNPGAPAVDQ